MKLLTGLLSGMIVVFACYGAFVLLVALMSVLQTGG